MSRIATPETESYLLYIAENGTACHMERLVRSYQRASRAEDPEEARRQREDRYLEIYPDDDGMVIIRGRLPREVAALLEKALEAAMDALNQEEPGPVIPTQSGIPQQQSGTPDPAELHNPCSCAAPEDVAKSRNQSRGTGTHDSAESRTPGVVPAEAGIREHQIDLQLPKSFLASRTRPAARPADDSAESSASSGPDDPARPERAARFALSPGGGWPSLRDPAGSWIHGDYAQRRVDALGLLAEAALGHGLGRTGRGEPYQVTIHVDSAILADEADDGVCELENGDGISGEACRRIACDAPTVTVIRDDQGNLLDVGRKARKISTPLWRALMSRDRTCQFPGCPRTRHLQAHHIEHWAKGGETSPTNLILLCRAHHWAVHDGGLRVDGRAPYGLVFYREDGSVLPVSPPRLPIRGAAGETLKEVNRKHGLELSADTVDRFWDGGAMDYHMAVEGLIDCERHNSDDEK
jgi:hypothetical protein